MSFRCDSEREKLPDQDKTDKPGRGVVSIEGAFAKNFNAPPTHPYELTLAIMELTIGLNRTLIT